MITYTCDCCKTATIERPNFQPPSADWAHVSVQCHNVPKPTHKDRLRYGASAYMLARNLVFCPDCCLKLVEKFGPVDQVERETVEEALHDFVLDILQENPQ